MMFDSIFFLCIGLLSIILGVLNKDKSVFGFYLYDDLKKTKRTRQIMNIAFGVLSIIIALFLLNKQ